MEFIKLNLDWDAEPNAPIPKIEIVGENLRLSFYLNTFVYDNFNENDLGLLEFHNCYQYRMGPPNDEGFYIYNQCRYKKYGLNWGDFYLVQNSDWQSNFPQPIIVDASLNAENLKHYLFYFRNETFECISENYSFNIIASGVCRNDSEL